MLPPLIRRPQKKRRAESRQPERGFTMALVALSLVAIIAMAALSIDIGTLYQAKAEAQRAADAAALTAARVISISGITGDPTNTTSSWQPTCGGASSAATLAAISVAQQNLVSGVAVLSTNISVKYGAGSTGATTPDCSSVASGFGVNPVVTVTVQSGKLPIFFARVFSLVGSNFSGTTVSAAATAEVFNSSNSGTVASKMIPVGPRCAKPWIIPNINPATGAPFVSTVDGSINLLAQGVLQLGGGVIGYTFPIGADCKSGATDCKPPAGTGDMTNNPPQWGAPPTPPPTNVLQYVPALLAGTPGAVPSCGFTDPYQQAVAGCDQTTVYACGTTGGATADLTINPGGGAGDTSTAVQCLINQTSGRDTLDTGTAKKPVFPFQIHAGDGNPLVKAGLVPSDDVITSSNSIVTIPIADFSGGPLVGSQPTVTIVGFLQVFINDVDPNGNMDVTVLNVAGCGSSVVAGATYAYGTSPVPVRLITPP
jgi:Flp pilus assembly protein TadG